MEQVLIIKRGTPLTFECEVDGHMVRRHGTFRTVLDFLTTHRLPLNYSRPTIPPSFRLFVKGRPILYDYPLWLDSFSNMEKGIMKRCTVFVSSAGSYRATEVRND